MSEWRLGRWLKITGVARMNLLNAWNHILLLSLNHTRFKKFKVQFLLVIDGLKFFWFFLGLLLSLNHTRFKRFCKWMLRVTFFCCSRREVCVQCKVAFDGLLWLTETFMISHAAIEIISAIVISYTFVLWEHYLKRCSHGTYIIVAEYIK